MRRTPAAEVVAFRYAEIFNNALREVRAIKRRYLAQYQRFGFGALPTRYSRDLRAFAVMASATIEQCAEDLVWAHLYALASAIQSTGATAPLIMKGGERLRVLGEAVLDASHGIQSKHFKEIAAVGGFTRPLNVVEGNSFDQLGKLRGQAAHGYAVNIVDPNDVWSYTEDVLRVIRDLGIACATRTTGFRTV